MSHDRGWRAVCIVTFWSPNFHFEMREVARGVTAMVVGSGALLGRFTSVEAVDSCSHDASPMPAFVPPGA